MYKRIGGLLIIVLLAMSLFVQFADAQVEKNNNSSTINGKSLSLVGEITAQSQISVFTKIPGKIEKLNVEVGDHVRKGDILAIVEHDELELGVRQAKAILVTVQSGLVQAKALSEINVTSKVTQAQAGLSSAKATYEQAKALSYTRTTTQIAQAEAGLEALKATMKKIRAGARVQEIKQVESLVEQAKAGMENAKSNYDRTKQLFDQGAVSKQTLDAVDTQYTVANAQYQAATQQLNLVNDGAQEEDIEAVEAQIRQAEAGLVLVRKLEETKNWEKDIAMAEALVSQAEANLKLATAAQESKSWEADITKAEMGVEQANIALELAEKQLSYATITAPISGIISRRDIDLGGMASQQLPIFEIVDMDVVKAKVSVVEANFYRVKLGDVATVSIDALQQSAKGKVTLISPIIDKMTHTATIEINIDNKDYKLKPGMDDNIFCSPRFHLGFRNYQLRKLGYFLYLVKFNCRLVLWLFFLNL
jgi:multidrug resistance efflux pump